MDKFCDGYEAYINLAGLDKKALNAGHGKSLINLQDKPILNASISDGTAIFEEYERIRKAELLSSLLMAHLATTPRKLPEPDKHSGIVPDITASNSFTHPDAYICFNGDMAIYDASKCEGILEKKRQKEIGEISILTKVAKCVTMK